MKYFFPLLLLLFWRNLNAQYEVHFIINELSVPAQDNIYITGSFNDWDPGNPKYKLNTLDGGLKSIVLNLPAGKFEYKFTRGSWVTIEKDLECREIENRVVNIEGDTTITVLIEQWKDICQVQDTSLASVLQQLQFQKIDSFKVALLNRLSAIALLKLDDSMALNYAWEAYSLADKIGFKRGKARAYSVIGNIYYAYVNYPEARKYYFAALVLYEGLNSKLNSAFIIQRIGGAHFNEGKYDEAIKYWYQCLRTYELLGDQFSIARCRALIAEVFWRLNNDAEGLIKFKQAMKSFEESWALHKENWMRANIANCYNSIAKIYLRQDNFSEAMYYDSISYELYVEIKDEMGISMALSTMGSIKAKEGEAAMKSGDQLTASYRFSEALILLEKSDYPEALIEMGKIYLAQKNFKEARRHLEKGLAYSQAMDNEEYLMKSYLGLSALDSAGGNYKQAYENYKKYFFYRHRLLNEEITRNTEFYKIKFEIEKKEDEIKLLTTENELSTAIAAKAKQENQFAYAGLVSLFILGGFGFYRFRLYKNLKSKQALTNERFRISRDLHDEVGATLSGIVMYSHLAKSQAKNNIHDVEQSLDIVQETASEMVNKLNDVVWLVNPEKDNLEKLIEKLEDYGVQSAQTKNINFILNAPENLDSLALPIEIRKNIYLFCKEAINNAVKYSEGTEIELKVQQPDHQLEFSIRDNGIGFDPEKVKRGNGLNNMQNRANEIGAKLIIDSSPNLGTKSQLLIIRR